MKRILGIELGSTRIKSVLVDEKMSILAVGVYQWENEYIDGHWSYSLNRVIDGLQESYRRLVDDLGYPLKKVDAIGISGMMHGYLAFDKDWNLLVPFRTWQDTTTAQASSILSEKLKFNMPLRWSATHYYQAILNKEEHVEKVCHLQTLSGYINFLLTGKNVIGPNDASGMFPVIEGDFDKKRAEMYSELIGKDILEILPQVLLAGSKAGVLTLEGARLIDPTGNLEEGCLMCPPEGDMGTGMVCTNAISIGTGQISSGTSANLSVVLKRPLVDYYPQVDIISTPDGNPTALIHANNCTADINEWVDLFSEVIELNGGKVDKKDLISKLFVKSKESDEDTGGLVIYNFISGEPLAGIEKGIPVVARKCDGKLSLSNFMKAHVYSAIASLSLGLDILKKEDVEIKKLIAHGGYYKTEGIGQIATSALLDAPVTVYNNAGEGGAWGIAILAGYMLEGKGTFQEYLDSIFSVFSQTTLLANEEDKRKCRNYIERFKAWIDLEKQDL